MAYGLHYTDTLAGRVFAQSATPLGLAIPIYTATAIAGGMPIWNPPTSNRNVELISVDIDYGSGTSVYGSVGLMGLPLAAIATGALCTALAATTPTNGFLLGGASSRVISSNAGTVTVTAGVATAPSATAPGWIRGLASINLEAQTGTAHATGIQKYVFDGTVIIPPGVMVYLAATLASVALFCSSIVWKEIPINAQAG
jgi:hypothetical protein